MTKYTERPQSFCEKVEAVAMDAFAGYKKAAARQVPHAVEILDPFHIVKLAGDKVTAVRCRLQREATGRRGTRTDPLYRGRRILLKTASLRTDRQRNAPTSCLATRPTSRSPSRTASTRRSSPATRRRTVGRDGA